ncbi:ion channel CASTOR-like isoform X2 [Cucumis melo var. makuwa]|uniref:Ion channel CASTOR-like isoform X2 n=1 Tax=Cucumis melo var. makuwa TaxID=1194695 RepID=A0A5A7SU61_CUCMM|nr:ion channel CASTOR-like isoform X2 [Cucumis melo var. makuwa]
MSLDSESSPSSSRDWFFPPQSFLHSHPAKSPNYIRRFSDTSRLSRRYTDYHRYRKTSSCISDSHSCSTITNDVKFARSRRRFYFDRRSDLSLKRSEVEFSSKPKLELPDVSSSAKKVSDTSRLSKSFDSSLKVRWLFLAIAASIFVVSFATIVHENLSLQEQVNNLETRISNLNIKLRACNLFDHGNEDDVRSPDELADVVTDKRLKTLALIASLTLLFAPIIILKYIDYISKSRSLDHNLEEISLNKRLAYKVDVFFSIHPYAKPLALLIATLLLIMLGGLALFGVTDDNLVDCLWLSWTYVADSGNHANSEGFGPRLVSVSVSFGGMLIFAMMLGLVSDSISEKFDSLRKGRSEVVEQNHTLILGWSDKLGSLLNQISIANESLGGGIVVVMAERDKEEMELDIAKMEFDFKGTSVICRTGSPLILADLKKVSVSKARAIIVIAEDGNADQSDARALRTVLSLTGVKEGLRGHIVVELSDLDNEVLVKLVGGELVETVVAHDVIGRLMIQCARQPGLAQIWEDILGFENCEFYIKRWPQLTGMQFEDVLISFPDAIPCGIKVASRGGKIVLNPEDSYVLEEGDEVLVIAEDDDTYAPAPLPTVREASFIHIARPTRKPQKILLCGWRRDIDDMIVVWRGSLPKDFIVPKSAERILLCGWRRDMEDMIMVLDAFLAPGSELWMFNDVPENEREKKLVDGGLDISRLENISLVDREGNAVIRRHLESLPLESFDSILILADESVEDSAIQADSRSLATLLLIRDIQAKRMPVRDAKATAHKGSFSQGSWIGEMQQASDKSVIISEILDPRTKNLLSMSKISDYVLSNELVSMALAMVAEDRQINDVLEELFAEEGNELHIRQADLYLREGEELSFYEVLLRARQRREVVIGYRSANAERAVINPPAKNERRKWSLRDVFVVIAEKE